MKGLYQVWGMTLLLELFKDIYLKFAGVINTIMKEILI